MSFVIIYFTIIIYIKINKVINYIEFWLIILKYYFYFLKSI